MRGWWEWEARGSLPRRWRRSSYVGFAQIVMLQRIRETLAGCVFIYEPWPLMLSELVGGQAPSRPPLLADLLDSNGKADDLLSTYAPVLLGDDAHQRARWLAHGLLLLTTPTGIWGIEVKTAAATKVLQVTPLRRRLAAEFGSAWRGGIVAYLGERIERLDADLWAAPVSRLLTG